MTREIAVIGFGNQGGPWALNLRDSGWGVRVLIRPESQKRDLLFKSGFIPESLEVVGTVPMVAILLPDDVMPEFFNRHASLFRPGQSLIFAHGFALHYKTVAWPQDIDRILVAPKGIGRAVRDRFVAGSGVPAVLAVDHDATGNAWKIAESVAQGLGAERVGTYRATVAEEVEADLFSEQAILCGGLPALVAETYDVLVKNGVRPEVAYLECVHELGYMAELFQELGIGETLRHASSTAQFGGIRGGKKLLAAPLRPVLEEMFRNIREGSFYGELKDEAKTGFPTTQSGIAEWDAAPIESVGRRVRKGIRPV